MKDLHVHTKTTDGTASPAEIIALAESLGLETIAFTEHISKNPSYDWFQFRDDIHRVASKVKVLVGVEAKVLDASGGLNVCGDVREAADIVLGSCHGAGKVEWLLKSCCDVVAHPQIDAANIAYFLGCPKILEINSKHRLPYEVLDKLVESGNVFSFGSDAHSLSDLVEAQIYFGQIKKRYPQIRLTEKF